MESELDLSFQEPEAQMVLFAADEGITTYSKSRPEGGNPPEEL